MTVDLLRAQTRKSLAALARTRRIAGWHAMRKDELVRVLAASGVARNGNGARSARVRRHTTANGGACAAPRCQSDQLVVEAQSSHWVRLTWTLSPQIVARARLALKTQWHAAVPVIRIFEISDEGEATGWTPARDVEVRGNMDHWYLPVEDAPCRLRFAIGYRAPDGRFFAMARSRTFQMPRPGARSASSEPCNGWKPRDGAGYSGGLVPAERFEDLRLRVDAELVLRGSARPGSRVTCLGRRVDVAADGSFLIRVPLPDGRQVIPAVVTLPEASEERTVIVAVERNTRELEPRNLNELPY